MRVAGVGQVPAAQHPWVGDPSVVVLYVQSYWVRDQPDDLFVRGDTSWERGR
jgi:hypothetical protein